MITSLIDFFISYIRRAPVAEYQSQPATVEHLRISLTRDQFLPDN